MKPNTYGIQYSSITYKLGESYTLNIYTDQHDNIVGIYHAHSTMRGSAFRDLFDNAPRILGSTSTALFKVQMQEYVSGQRTSFDIPFSIIAGTPFQKKVWNELLSIKYGDITTYGSIATKITKNKSRSTSFLSRAIGSAVRTNSLSIVVPCHRVLTQQSYQNIRTLQQNNQENIEQSLSIALVGNYHGGSKIKLELLRRELQANDPV